jgi:hypothetical protein
MQVELFGQPCVNPDEHGKAKKDGFTVLLTDSYTGCDANLGSNPYA